ncbi:carbohydrate-binding module family 14 protein [Pseudocercospora fijiensis CIRAD86]|uniref:Carbohydrate-binding module family 14 protein n=1 Tax=Pseudocercospora fijiensis (strain CIRAD86) TaxID=383855 RepID=M3AZE0_PSEFD|nr:carbohydrate-binding module family 14 protein [Pseudocercospora fijiensis CIRAD86]EME82543.1 carbohydrate-binding module family 14 protein [Pseudocercospora fijiensis CIRAD86]
MLSTTRITLLATFALATTSYAGTMQVRDTAPAFVCPSADITATKCLGPKDCLYPNPKTCNGYIQCSPADASYTTGIVHEMPCPSGLQWNDNQKWCDWPENSTCGNTGGTIYRCDETGCDNV